MVRLFLLPTLIIEFVLTTLMSYQTSTCKYIISEGSKYSGFHEIDILVLWDGELLGEPCNITLQRICVFSDTTVRTSNLTIFVFLVNFKNNLVTE
jgi:hypothetical protein